MLAIVAIGELVYEEDPDKGSGSISIVVAAAAVETVSSTFEFTFASFEVEVESRVGFRFKSGAPTEAAPVTGDRSSEANFSSR